ncbi:hypothetical protein SDC9_88382 [bioreactor metagenome]|uniref:Uncharacterized protein n=1 Tax=bioreactor metagenome TaxID=1076179 RepID=A0A644ZLS6_9ZZZZ
MKISVKEVLLDALSLDKKKFLPLAGVSLMVTMLGMTSNFVNYFIGQTYLHPDQTFQLWLAIIFLLFVYTVIEPKLLLVPYILINAFLSGEMMSIREAYRDTKGKYWTALLYQLIPGSAAALRIWFIDYLYQTSIPMTITTIISYASSICISSVFFLLFVMIAIEEKTDNYLKKSFALIKRNLPAILLILTFFSVLKTIPNLTLPSLITEVYKRQDNIQALRLAYRIANFLFRQSLGF